MTPRLEAGRSRSRRRADGASRRPACARSAALLSAPVLRWDAPASDDRHGPVLLAEAADRRRADDGTRRDDSGPNPRGAAPAPRRIGRRDHPRDPRSRRRRRHRRPDRRHVRGRVVEQATVEELFDDPQHPYTWGLLGSIMRVDRDRSQRLPAIPGTPPSLLRTPKGCHFRPRCPHAFERCVEVPALTAKISAAPDHLDRCWLEPPRKRKVRMVGDQIGLAAPAAGE